jgi:DNA-binding response OmpR family regulator
MQLDMKKILLVDDEDAILFAFSKILQTKDMHVDTAQSTQEAETMLSQSSYEAVIVDLRLNGTDQTDGLTVVSMAKQRSQGSKIVVMTAYGSEKEKAFLEETGVDAYLEKPVSPTNLKQILGSLGVY